MSFEKEIDRRRTFGIISHPDAGKTTLTEKLLLFGGAIQEAGAVKSNKIKKGATSDFMEIERQRGMQPAARPAGHVHCQRHRGRQNRGTPHHRQRRCVPHGNRGQRVPQPPVLISP